MMQVKLTRRWGPHSAGRTVQVDDEQARWLVNHNYAEAASLTAPVQAPAAEGTHGADPLAGGDATRRRPRIQRPVREEGRNLAAPIPGSSPTYRGGYDAEARKREGEAGRNVQAAQEPAAGSGDAKKPARRRTKSGD